MAGTGQPPVTNRKSTNGFAGGPAQTPCQSAGSGSERPAAFRQTILPHLDAAYSLARFLARDRDAAEDIVQDAFLRAFRAYDGFRGEDAKAWILAITRNCFLSWVKARNTASAVSVQIDHAGDTEAGPSMAEGFAGEDEESPEKALIRRDEIEMIRAAIEDLPPLFREVLVLREFEELTYQQIAQLTAVPIGTVMSRLARGRQMLAKAWQNLSKNSQDR